MHFFLFHLILFLIVQINLALHYSNYEYTSAVKLNNYNSYYGNAKIQRYSIPSDASQAQWYFQVRASPTCPNTPIYIYLEYAGYPVVAPLNETFPSDFDLNRLTKTFTIIKVSGLSSSYGIQSANISINNPKSGNWYSAAFYINDDIVNIVTCSFYLASMTNIWINEEVTVLSINTPLSISGPINLSNYNMFKYLTTSHAPLDLNIKLNNDSSSCVLNAYVRQLALPIINLNDSIYDSYVSCNNSYFQCLLTIQYPVGKTWYYIAISSNCSSYLLHLNSTFQLNSNILKTTRLLGSSPYNTKYYLNPSNTYNLETDSTPNFFEYLFDHSTIGGTLNLLVSNRIAASTQLPKNVSVYFNGCLMFNSLDQYTDCSQGYKLKTRASLSDSTSSHLSIAYPMSGNWYLAMWQECLNSETNSHIECPKAYPVGATVQVSTDQCANNYCGDYGTCNVVALGTNLISVCQCGSNYGGYACLASSAVNNTKIVKDNIGEVIFLTLSNLMFLVPIFLALDRRYFIEALIYSYTMFFSIFYHACGASSYNFCIFNYNGLQLADYIGAYGSFVITLLFIADLDRYWQIFGYFLGLLLCIALSLNDRYNTSSFIIVIVIAGLITIASWINVWWQTGDVYPPKRQLIFYIPGLILAITGVILFLAVESGSNYWLTHSFWHMMIAFSIVFFMPEGEENKEPLFKFVRELIYGESNTTNNNVNAFNSANMNNRSNGF